MRRRFLLVAGLFAALLCGASLYVLWQRSYAHVLRATLRGQRLEGKSQGLAVWCVAFSPDGRTLAGGYADNSVKYWDVASGKNTSTVEAATGFLGVTSLAFSPNGKILASSSGGEDCTIRLWNVANGMNTGKLIGHSNVIESVAFIDNKTLASCSADKTIKLWDILSGKVMAVLEGHSDIVFCIAASRDGKRR
jgi:WD40 repeat protein